MKALLSGVEGEAPGTERQLRSLPGLAVPLAAGLYKLPHPFPGSSHSAHLLYVRRHLTPEASSWVFSFALPRLIGDFVS